MAEESSPVTSPLSHTPLTKDPSSTIDTILDKPQQTQKPFSSNFHECPLIESEKFSLGDLGKVSGVFNGFFADCNEVSCVKLVGNDEKFKGFSDKNGISGVVLNKDHVGFNKEDEFDEFVELKEEVGAMGKSSSSEFNQLGSSESPSDNTLHELNSLESKMWDGISKNSDVELIDDTVVVDLSDKVGKKSRVRAKKGHSNSVGIAASSNGARQKLQYSRKELEKLKSVNVKSQKKFWQKVYNGFDDNVRKEYGELNSFRQNNKHQAARKRNHCYQGNLGLFTSSGDSTSEDLIHNLETRNSADVDFDGESSGKYGENMEWSEDEKSDDEYQSIQRPAFRVEGEPDFETGPPEDGFEYLRRVRWEAAHIPKVMVVRLDNSKVTEQSVYMPKIPDIEKCPPHLAPLRQWEDAFVADFSELRQALTTLRDTSEATSVDSDTTIYRRPECTKRNFKSAASLELPSGVPSICTLLAMDPITRVGLLNRQISLFKSASNSSKDEYVWLFALCAVVETPLDANTSASLRCLLRKCAKLRAEKDVFDDEVAMLNILVTIAGKFFGQSEN